MGVKVACWRPLLAHLLAEADQPYQEGNAAKVAKVDPLVARVAVMELPATYLSLEIEGQLIRSGKILNGQPSVVVVGGKNLTLREGDVELELQSKVTGLITLQETLGLRARSFAMLKLASFEVLRKLTGKFTSVARQTCPAGMRPPTINEVRLFDRTMWEQILKWKAHSSGEIDEGLSRYLTNPQAELWRLVEAVMEEKGSAPNAPVKPPEVLGVRQEALAEMHHHKGVASGGEAEEERSACGQGKGRAQAAQEEGQLPRAAMPDNAARGTDAERSSALQGSRFSAGPLCSQIFRVLEPWDILRGRDVFLHKEGLQEDLTLCEVFHHSPNGATFSRARELPIKGVLDPPKPFRSDSSPRGLTEELKLLLV